MSVFARTATGDLTITAGNLAIVRDPITECALKIKARLALWLGEWFLDVRQGVPWYRVLGKDLDTVTTQQILRKVIAETPGVGSVDYVKVRDVGASRTRQITYSARTDAGAVITGGQGLPLVLGVAS